MRNLILLLLLPICSIAQPHVSDEQQIRNTIVTMFDGFSERSPQKIRKCTTDDFLLLENGAVWNNDTLTEKMNKLKNNVVSFQRINAIGFIRVSVRGNTAWAAFNNSANITMDSKHRNTSWLESAVLIRIRHQWKIQMYHSTVLHNEIN